MIFTIMPEAVPRWAVLYNIHAIFPQYHTIYHMMYHDLLQAYSRTNRVEKETKPWGIIVCYRNLKQKTDDAIALFSKGQSQGVLTQSFEFYAQKFNELVTHIKEIAPTPASIAFCLLIHGKETGIHIRILSVMLTLSCRTP